MKKSHKHIQPKRVKSVYRGARARTSPLTVIIIVMLTLLVLTLTFLLFKNQIYKLFTDTPETSTEQTENTPGDESTSEAETTVGGLSSFDLTTLTLPNTQLTRGELILVNREHEYVFSQDDVFASLFTDSTTAHFSLAGSTIKLSQSAYNALRKMTDAYYAAMGDESLMVTSGVRNYNEQQEYYDYWVKDKNGNVVEEDAPYFELPGYSDHHTGLGFDVKIYDSEGKSYSYSKYCVEKMAWMVEHHAEYGFIMRYPTLKAEYTGITEEGNHFRYVGTPHAVYMEENSLCLEEYLELLKSYTPDTEPLRITASGTEYAVYYVAAASGDTTDVPVPSGMEYTVSGDNVGGYIVTVKIGT